MAEIKLEGADQILARLRELQSQAPAAFHAALKTECEQVMADLAPVFARACLLYRLTAPPEDDSEILSPVEKVARAKQLLMEATREARSARKAADAADLCACGHRRDEHTVSYSINYTEGFCMVCPEVKGHSTCRWFNYQPRQTRKD